MSAEFLIEELVNEEVAKITDSIKKSIDECVMSTLSRALAERGEEAFIRECIHFGKFQVLEENGTHTSLVDLARRYGDTYNLLNKTFKAVKFGGLNSERSLYLTFTSYAFDTYNFVAKVQCREFRNDTEKAEVSICLFMPSEKVDKEIKEYKKYLPLLNDLWKEKVPNKALPKIYDSFVCTLGIKEKERVQLSNNLGKLIDYVDFRQCKVDSEILSGRESSRCFTQLPPSAALAFKYLNGFTSEHYRDKLSNNTSLDYKDVLRLMKEILITVLKSDVSNYNLVDRLKERGDRVLWEFLRSRESKGKLYFTDELLLDEYSAVQQGCKGYTQYLRTLLQK